jgi:hypothetical protein
LVAFLDILGLTDSIKETEKDPSKARPIADTLSGVRRITEIINRRRKMEFTAYSFSDSIIISCPRISEKTFIFMAHIIAIIQFGTMRHQFFSRGGIALPASFSQQARCHNMVVDFHTETLTSYSTGVINYYKYSHVENWQACG